MSNQSSRRQFLARTAIAGSALPWLSSLPPVSAQDQKMKQGVVRFSDRVEPLVRLIEDSSRDKLLGEMAQRIKSGASYREVLAALLLAGIRNVQPRPSVGFKFHCVLVVNSCHLASISGPDEDRWLPLFWGLNYFKSSQADEKRSSGWKMKPVNEARIPDASKSRQSFTDAMDRWDVEQADLATAGIVRHLGATEVFNLLATYAARDYRSIGHKAIYLANAWRTLQVIGWEYAEPVLRSLTFALLNHNGEPNPADSDLAADRPWRQNVEIARELPGNWLNGKVEAGATTDLFGAFRSGSPKAAAETAGTMLSANVSPHSVWDGVFVGAGELLMRQPGIIGLHGLTTANAMHYLWSQVESDELRRRLLLQACSFNPMFRESAKGRGKLSDGRVDSIAELKATPDNPGTLTAILDDVSGNKKEAAGKVLGFLNAGGSGVELVDAFRRVLFSKGRDAHDYKFTSAILEDFGHVTPEWRNQFLAMTVFQLRGSGDRDNGIMARTREALGA